MLSQPCHVCLIFSLFAGARIFYNLLAMVTLLNHLQKDFDDHLFVVCALRLWDCLPPSICGSSSLDIFKNILKSYLFKSLLVNVCKLSLFKLIFFVKSHGQFIGVACYS